MLLLWMFYVKSLNLKHRINQAYIIIMKIQKLDLLIAYVFR